MTSAVLAPARWFVPCLGLAVGLLGRTAEAAPGESEPDAPEPVEAHGSEPEGPEPADPDPVEPDPSEPDPSSPDEFDGDLGAIDDGPDQPDATDDPSDDAEATASDEPIRPPRVDGPYFGVFATGTASFPSVLDLDTPNPLFGGGGFVQAGDAVLPWMSIGVALGGHAGFNAKQKMWTAALLVEFGFLPIPRQPFSIRAGFGFGGGAVEEEGVPGRFGFGGAAFKASVRHEFFPLAAKRRPDRGGGWAIGPELGWLGATPSGKDQPFVNTILLGVSTSFYVGS